MSPKNPDSGPDELMDDLKSLKNTLDEGDNNVPLLLDDNDDDDDIPVLSDSDDIPVLDSDGGAAATADESSLEAALAELESMELAPKARTRPRPLDIPPPPPKAFTPTIEEKAGEENADSLEDRIKANARPPANQEEMTKVRANPFLNPAHKEQLEQSKRLREEAQSLAKIAALSRKPGQSPAQKNSVAPTTQTEPEETKKDKGDIEFTPGTPSTTAPTVIEDNEITKEKDLDLGEISDIDVESTLADLDSAVNSLSSDDIENAVNEVVAECLPILEDALRKKLKEKIPDLLK